MLEVFGECIHQEYNREKLHMPFRRLHCLFEVVSCMAFLFHVAPTKLHKFPLQQQHAKTHRRTMAELENMEAGGSEGIRPEDLE